MPAATCRILSLLLLVGLWQSALCSDAPLGLSAIHQLVTERKVSSVEELLSQLPTQYRSRFTLVFASRSLQGASFENPRVILYGADAQFILTFNGNAQDRGVESVEMLEFDPSARQFALQELTFRASPDGESSAEFSAINPEKCVGCHGKVSRPVWDTYPLWPGAYGEVHQERPSAAEIEGFEGFLRQQPAHPRYRHLMGVQAFAYRYRFSPTAREKYDAVQVESPNEELSVFLNRLNAQSIAAEIVRQEAFATHRYALLAAASRDCIDMEEFFPDDLRAAIRQRLREFSDLSDAINTRQLESKRDRLLPGSRLRGLALASSIDDADSLKRLRFMAETTLGLDTHAWTLALEKGSSDFTAPHRAIDEIERAMLDEVALGDRHVKALRVYGSPGGNSKYCSYLARQNRASLN
ncbi:hypothetical protein [Piscinibacter terrae]|uniref:Cytochrome c domain-containing protein n=1 Tax=Piscinibacter terrae TaxID=2496871 RepID=A0A3N7HH32_9BURK|nr:hypothetical protein [Albitalea terrae]RQP21334.1 hypothetical protein DZC73_27950 [Albitalea terrae]